MVFNIKFTRDFDSKAEKWLYYVTYITLNPIHDTFSHLLLCCHFFACVAFHWALGALEHGMGGISVSGDRVPSRAIPLKFKLNKSQT